MARRLPVRWVHRRHPLAGTVGFVQVARRHRPLQRHLRRAGVEVAPAEVVVGVPGVGAECEQDRLLAGAPAAGARRRTRGCGASCRRRRSSGRPRSSPMRQSASTVSSVAAGQPQPCSHASAGVAWSSTGTARSSNTTVRSAPIRATSIDTGRAAGRRQVQRHRCRRPRPIAASSTRSRSRTIGWVPRTRP